MGCDVSMFAHTAMSPRISALIAALDAEINAAEAVTAGLRRERAEIANVFAPALQIVPSALQTVPPVENKVRPRVWEYRPRRGAEMDGPLISRNRRLRPDGQEERWFPSNGYCAQADRLSIGTAGDNGGVWLSFAELALMQPPKQPTPKDTQ